MMLRRLAQALKEQNWTAIFIEFVLLVVGVFLGIQVANWNQARIDRVEYEAALARLDAEIEVNLSSLDASDVEIEKSLATGSLALTTLQSCTDSESNRQIVAAGIEEIRGTEGLHPRRNALDEITSNPRLLAQQSAAERQRFSEMLYYFDVLQQTANRSEQRPLEIGTEYNQLLRVGAPYRYSTTYYGADWVRTRRKLELGVSLSDACQDDRLIKSFFNWERSQGNLPLISRKWRMELIATKKLIGERQ